MSKDTRRIATAGTSALALLLLAACGGGGDGGTATGGGGDGEDRGPITYAQGMDASGVISKQVAEWNAAHPGEEVTFIELPASSDEQRQQHIQNAQTQSDAFSVISVDNVWVPEFAANQFIDELDPADFDQDLFIPSVWETGVYRDKLFAVPRQSDGGLLYYRTDLFEAAGIDAPPTTWDELLEQCDAIQATPEGVDVGCYAGQFEKYEGLTVNFTEVINSAGGTVTQEDGTPTVDTPEALAGVTDLVEGFESGAIPREAITFMEEEGRQAFQDGKLIFHRQWPYQYVLANADDGSSTVAGKFDVAALPSFGDGEVGRSTLGGWNLAIARYGKHKDTARDFVSWMVETERQEQNLLEASLAPVYTSLYDDAALIEEYPYLPALKESILNAEPRPRVVNYGDVTAAIQDAAYDAITGVTTPEQALSSLQARLEELTAN